MRKKLDMEVLLNNQERTRVRLRAAPFNAETASLRRMRAKKDTRDHNPSAAVLEVMDWTIFLTELYDTILKQSAQALRDIIATKTKGGLPGFTSVLR